MIGLAAHYTEDLGQEKIKGSEQLVKSTSEEVSGDGRGGTCVCGGSVDRIANEFKNMGVESIYEKSRHQKDNVMRRKRS